MKDHSVSLQAHAASCLTALLLAMDCPAVILAMSAQDVIKSGKDKLSAAYSGAADLLSGWGGGEKPADAASSEL